MFGKMSWTLRDEHQWNLLASERRISHALLCVATCMSALQSRHCDVGTQFSGVLKSKSSLWLEYWISIFYLGSFEMLETCMFSERWKSQSIMVPSLSPWLSLNTSTRSDSLQIEQRCSGRRCSDRRNYTNCGWSGALLYVWSCNLLGLPSTDLHVTLHDHSDHSGGPVLNFSLPHKRLTLLTSYF